ncbi:MAG TPA: DUF6624 domain-containing protein [Candidatus Saccharimonadales bacterium]
MIAKLDKKFFKAELKKRAAKDKEMRLHAMEGLPWDASVDKDNTAWIKDIITTHGWPAVSEYGKSTLEDLWLLVQHADYDPAFQEYCLDLMKECSPEEINLSDMAFLEDRVRVNTGRKQLYGTQFHTTGEGKFEPQPIEDEANLKLRRKAAGLNSFEEYTTVMMRLYKKNGK